VELKNNRVYKGLQHFFALFGVLVFAALIFVFITNAGGIASLVSVVGWVKSQSLYAAQNDRMLEGAMAGIVESLNDPYSKYLNKAQWQELNLQLKAEFGGIGVYVVEMEGGKLGIVNPIKGAPAARKGLKHGDIITRINDKSAANMTQDEAVHLMRGEPGTQLELSIYRPSDKQEYTFRIVREKIDVPSVEDKVLPGQPVLGYIKLNQFHSRSPQEIADSLNRLDAQDVQGLIVDLRDNGGGDFDAAIAIADIFLEDKDIVSVKDARGRQTIHQGEKGSYKNLWRYWLMATVPARRKCCPEPCGIMGGRSWWEKRPLAKV
jgi:carboxyl-terminal processing protease